MPIENAEKIGGLNPLWPLGSDPKSEGDNHLRLIKRTLVALSVELSALLQGEINVLSYGAIGDGTLHTLQEWVNSGKYTGLAAIQVVYPKATSLTQSIDYIAIQTALDTGRGVDIPKGNYVVTEEIEQVTPGQHVYFENSGGYGYGEDIGLNWLPNTRIIAKGTFAGRIRTRRNFRANSGAPEDAPLSVVWNIQAEATFLHNPCIWLACDYTNLSPTNLGDYCDVGIFIGCRVGVQLINPQVIGYFRATGIHFDVTHATTLPRHLNKAGVPYAMGVNVSGADGCGIRNPYIRGPRRGLGIIGAKPKTGQTTYSDPYYDQQLGTTVPDTRGTFGFSDFICDGGGRIYGPDHHSNRRLWDPVLSGGVLNQTSLDAAPDDAPCAAFIDGMAGNSSGGLWGMRFIGTRFATFEAFRVRLGRCARIMPIGCHVEGRNGGRFSSTGVPIDTNDYTTRSYGDYAGTSATSRLLISGSVRTSPTDAYPHYYGSTVAMMTDYGDAFFESYRPSRVDEDLDLRVASTSQHFLWRYGDVSGVTLTSNGFAFKEAIYGAGAAVVAEAGNMAMKGKLGVSLYEDITSVATFTIASTVISSNTVRAEAVVGEFDLRCGTGSLVRFRAGTSTIATFSAADLVSVATASIIRPNVDNTVPLCTAARRASVVYAGTPTINTSDRDVKTEIRDLNEAELAVARRLRPKMFKFKDAYASKGETARTHCGFIAQEVQAAFEAEGLDAFSYGILCWDSWEEEADVFDEDGVLLQSGVAAGSRYGLRYEELHSFILTIVLRSL